MEGVPAGQQRRYTLWQPAVARAVLATAHTAACACACACAWVSLAPHSTVVVARLSARSSRRGVPRRLRSHHVGGCQLRGSGGVEQRPPAGYSRDAAPTTPARLPCERTTFFHGLPSADDISFSLAACAHRVFIEIIARGSCSSIIQSSACVRACVRACCVPACLAHARALIRVYIAGRDERRGET